MVGTSNLGCWNLHWSVEWISTTNYHFRIGIPNLGHTYHFCSALYIYIQIYMIHLRLHIVHYIYIYIHIIYFTYRIYIYIYTHVYIYTFIYVCLLWGYNTELYAAGEVTPRASHRVGDARGSPDIQWLKLLRGNIFRFPFNGFKLIWDRCFRLFQDYLSNFCIWKWGLLDWKA